MPGLAQSLEGQDLGHLRIVAELWGIELQAPDLRTALQQLEERMPAAVAEGQAGLSKPVQLALGALSAEGGRQPWGQFIRMCGEIRELGPGRRDKEQPHLQPVSTAEQIWYRGLVGRAFFDTAEGLREFAYIPDDLLAVIGASLPFVKTFGRPARPEERAQIFPANDHILDQACTLLAGLRLGLAEEEILAAEDWSLEPRALTALLVAAGILDVKGKPVPESVRHFLEAPRSQALAQLASAWLRSTDFNELALVPNLYMEGAWENEPLATRQKVLAFLRGAPPEQWWSMPALLADVKARQPDFQRPAGEFDSWYLRTPGGAYLRGFAHWDLVDGALIEYLVRSPLHALGFVDLAGPPSGIPVAFRWSGWAQSLLNGEKPRGQKTESMKLRIDSQGKILIPGLAPRAARYLVARFCEWRPRQKDGAVYQISAVSMEQARKQGLKVAQLLTLLKSNSAAPLPPNLVQALKRWEQSGTQARLGSTLVLRLSSAASLKALRASRAARYLGEPLGPTAVTIKPGAGSQVLQVLLELGYLGELETEN